MKDIKCPVCGNKITLHYFIGGYLYGESLKGTYHFSCSHCRWMIETGRGTEELALREVEKFISKFPPIMRISPGDRLAYDGWVCVVTSIDREKCTIDVVSTNPAEPFDPGIEDFTPPIDGSEITPGFVDAWPWELKQREGAEQ